MVIQHSQDSGRIVSHYRLLERLGSGGMGVVYKAQDLVLERFVALKFLPAGRGNPHSRQRLLQEARTASRLDHPNVCTIFEVEEIDEGELFIAMALCEGETLRERISPGPLDIDEALGLTCQIAAGLAHAHDRGVVHRDIKPANLILSPSGQLKIVDFGVALQADRSRLTREGIAVGTVAYMSPEQLRGRSVDHRTDLWALGVVLYELLTGRLPFDSANDQAYAASVLFARPKPVTSQRAGLPASIDPLLVRLLAKSPDHRYQQAEEVIRDLQALRAGSAAEPGAVSTASSTLPLGPSSWPLSSKKPDLSIHPRVADLFVGRGDELRRIGERLLPEAAEGLSAAVCAVQGMPGVGKSFLTDRFAHEYADRFPGGYLRFVIDPKKPETPETVLNELADRLKIPGGSDLMERVRQRLCWPRTLLHLENVDSPNAEVTVGRLLQELPGAAVIVTGRLHDLGLAFGWHPIRIGVWDEETALAQLRGELGWAPAESENAGYRELVRSLGYLPLAVHLAAGHLRSGRSVTGFLRMLRQRRLALTPADRAELAVGVSEEARKVLATSFSISFEILQKEVGPEADRLLAGFLALGQAPLSGFGRSLGAAIAGLLDDDFEELVFHAQKLGLLLPIPREERPDGAWRLHPLLAEFLGVDSQASEVIDRMTEWFLARFPEGVPGEEALQGLRWREIGMEGAALSYWLPRVPASDRSRVGSAANFFAARNGPFHLWMEFCMAALEELTEPKDRSDFLWMLSYIARRHGLLETALEVAYEKLDIDSKMEDEYEVAISWGVIGDVLRALGRLDEAVAVWHQQEIPIQERLGNERGRAIALYKIAEILRLRESFDEALQVLQAEVVPAFEKCRDIRSRAIALGLIADILQSQGDLDSALRIRQTEELPIYEMLGESRSKGVVIGKIASILHSRGEPERALEISQNQEKAIFEKLGETRELAVCLGRMAEILRSLGRIDEAIQIRKSEQIPRLNQLGSAYDLLFAQEGLALLLLERQQAGDRKQAAELLSQALEAARRLRLPVADRIRSVLEEHGFTEPVQP
ncbi:MAG TPA: protein kinase [Thermoanaerobaculia bacterium]|nr:protein kinase [Thermoanaerobaculia bacterium]